MKKSKNVHKKEDKFDKLARLIKEEGEEIRKELGSQLESLSAKVDKKADGREMQEGFTDVTRRIDNIIQPQLDSHAGRIKKLETKVFS